MASIRQQKAVAALANGATSTGQAMREAGYTKSVSKVPKKLTNTKGFQELIKKFLPEDLLLRVHLEGLAAVKMEHKIIGRDDDGQPEYDFVKVDDYQTRHKYLDTAYKLKGSYAPERSLSLQVKGDIKDFAKYQELTAKYEAELLAKYQGD